MNGYCGKILWVDLATGVLQEEELDGADALGPENILGFLAGTLTGTSALGGSRFPVPGVQPQPRRELHSGAFALGG